MAAKLAGGGMIKEMSGRRSVEKKVGSGGRGSGGHFKGQRTDANEHTLVVWPWAHGNCEQVDERKQAGSEV